MMDLQTYRTWAEIDLDALAHNMREIKKATNPNVKIMAVIKANGYGHGALMCYKVLSENGADCFAVATLPEAIELRNGGVHEPILVLGYVPAQATTQLLETDALVAVTDYASAKAFSEAAALANKTLKIHIKLDTGMGRLGFCATDAGKTIEEIEKIAALPHLKIDGIFSHFSCSDTDAEYTNLQYDRFMQVCDGLQARGVNIGLRHICNSAGIVLEKDKQLDMVRPGIILYGLHPDASTHGKIDLKPAMRWYARITHIKTVKAGTPISYGNTFVAPRDMRVGTVSIGYADGYARVMSGKAEMMVGDERVCQIGRICMDQCMIDLTDVHTVNVGDTVCLMGEEITADVLAALQNTINYEVVCDVGARVTRVYKGN